VHTGARAGRRHVRSQQAQGHVARYHWVRGQLQATVCEECG